MSAHYWYARGYHDARQIQHRLCVIGLGAPYPFESNYKFSTDDEKLTYRYGYCAGVADDFDGFEEDAA